MGYYSVKIIKGEYAGTNKRISSRYRGRFKTKTSAKNAVIRGIKKGNPWARKVSSGKILSMVKIIKRR